MIDWPVPQGLKLKPILISGLVIADCQMKIAIELWNRIFKLGSTICFGLELYPKPRKAKHFWWDKAKLPDFTSLIKHWLIHLQEEVDFKLIHTCVDRVGFLNFQIAPTDSPDNLQSFLSSTPKGIHFKSAPIIQKGTQNFGNFSDWDRGFQLSFWFWTTGKTEADSDH